MSKADAQIWVVDSLTKVFRSDLPPPRRQTAIRIDAARNEYEHAQIAIRPIDKHMPLTVEFDYPKHKTSGAVIKDIKAELVGYVPLWVNTYYKDYPEEVIRKAPDLFPDPIWPLPSRHPGAADSIDFINQPVLLANLTQPIWITIKIPPQTPAGIYSGAIRIKSPFHEYPCALAVHVYPVSVPDKRHLFVTNWFFPDRIAAAYHVEKYSDAFYSIFEKYLDHMADHRQNVGWVPVMDLVTVKSNARNRWAFSFERLDRYVETLIRHRLADLLEGTPLAARKDRVVKGKKETRFYSNLPGSGTKGLCRVDTDSSEARSFFGCFLPALHEHLKKKGWLKRWIQHVADEPGADNSRYCQLLQLVKSKLPGVRIIEAVQNVKEDIGIDIPVPFVTTLINDNASIRSLKKAGREVWYYICCHPGGHWPNRFIDFCLMKTRVLHWINFFYDCPGYLHWGYNYWCYPDPYLEVAPLQAQGSNTFGLPPGDTHIVYPGPEGPVNSIRFDVQRDSIEDYELLIRLAQFDRKQAMRIASKIILDPFAPGDLPRRFNWNIANLRRVRRELLTALADRERKR